MVIVKLLGGLGNQMFQYATGRAVAHRSRVELLLDVSGFEHYDLRRYELDEWAIQARVATPEELARAGVATTSPRLLLRRIGRALGLVRPLDSFKEASFAYDSGILQVASPAYLEGYWQSESYFSDVADLLRREFVPKRPFDVSNQAIAIRIHDQGIHAVSLHIRRGDYVTNPHTAQYHGACSLDYYRSAVNYVSERVSNPHFFVFSDDLTWVRENLNLDYAMTLVDVNGSDRGIWDMNLMMACRHHVIANSSFSWWGAWLNPNQDKIVIAPKRWFSGASHRTGDLIPASWIQL